jgi:hypothetical protein
MNHLRPLTTACLVAISLAVSVPLVVRGGEPKAQTPSRPTAAFLDADRSSLGALVEQRLLADPRATWLERVEIGRMLAEQKIGKLFGAAAGSDRVALGRLLKAEVLVVLRSGEQRGQLFAELVVAETGGGLRLLVRKLPLTGRTEADADALARLVEEGLAKHREEIKEVCAVPPFHSRDLAFEYEHLKKTYATLMEQRLLAAPGVIVVELAEAEAIAREYQLADPGERPRRRLPLYLLGEYRNEGLGEERRVTVALKLKRGEKVLGQTERELQPEQVLPFLNEAADRLAGWKAPPPAGTDAAAEAQELARRSAEFVALGQWDEALALAEASLLIRPGQADALYVAVEAATGLSICTKYPRRVEELLKPLSYRLRGIEHLESLSKCASLDNRYHRAFSGLIHPDRIHEHQRNRCELPDEVKALHEQVAKREREVLMRLVHEFAKVRRWTYSGAALRFALADLEPAERYSQRLAILLKYQEQADPRTLLKWYGHPLHDRFADSVEARRFLENLISSEQAGPELRAAAEREREEVRAFRQASSRPAPPPIAGPATASRLGFRPVEIAYTGFRGRREIVYAVESCLPIDRGADVLYTFGSVLLLQKEGEAECLLRLSTPNVNSHTVAYDGRYVWLTAVFGSDKRLPEVWVLDPRSKETWQITAANGLPLHSSKQGTIETRGHQMVTVAAVSPGKAIIAGAFGRTWLASVNFDPEGNHDVRVFHEARQIAPDHPRLTTIAFVPWYMATLSPVAGAETAGTRILVGRSIPGRGDIFPLVVDADKLTVKVLPHKCYTRSRSDVYRGGVYGVTVVPPRRDALSVARVGLPNLAAEAVLEDVEEGIVVWQGDTVNVVGKKWWRGRPSDEMLECYGSVPWIFDNHSALSGPYENHRFQPGDIILDNIARSNIYGLLVSYGVWGRASKSRRPLQVVFDPPPGVPHGIPVQRVTTARGSHGKTVVQELDRDAVLVFSPNGQLMARGGWDGTLSLWSTKDWQQLGDLATLGRGIQDIAFSPDGSLLAASVFDESVRVWDVETKDVVFEATTPKGIAQRVSVHSKGHLATTEYRGVRLWDMDSGQSTLIETLHEIAGFQSDGTLIGSTHGFPRRLVAWDVDRGTCRRLWDEVIGELIGVSPDGRYLYTAKCEGGLEGHRGQVHRLRVWDVARQRVVIDNREHEAVKFMAETPHRVFLDTSMLPPPATLGE